MASKVLGVTLTALLLGLSANSPAANLYRQGTVPSMMFDVVSPVVGQRVTPVFILADKPKEFSKAIDPAAAARAGVSDDALRYYTQHLKPDVMQYGIKGYAIGGYGVPGNEQASRTCAIVISTAKFMQSTTTMFHEAVHCKNFAELRADPAAWRLAASMNAPWVGMTTDQYMSLYHEVLAAYIQVAYSANHGVQDGIAMVKDAALPDRNTATSIGYRTARNAIKRCSKKDACSTDSATITRMLANSPADRADMLLDLKELHKAAVDSGYVVESK